MVMIILQGNKCLKEVALLFDDGPNPYLTPKLLEVLRNKGVPANFFLIGMRTEQSPEIVRQIANAGHEIGNHTYTHKRLPQLLEEYGKQAVIDEVVKCKKVIEKASNLCEGEIKYLRPPYLDWNDKLAELVEPYYGDNILMSSLTVSDWDWGVDQDWNKEDKEAISQQAERIASEWKQITENGTLLGFHDSSEHNLPGNKHFDMWQNRALPTLEAIPHIIDFLIVEGFSINRLSDMELDKENYIDKRKSQ
jgi:peptidoglycan/xylan/chitin deacetylase (PgdA/CDA1 family)